MQNKDNPVIFIGLTKKELHQVLSVLRNTLEERKDPESELDIMSDAFHKVSDAFYSFDDK